MHQTIKQDLSNEEVAELSGSSNLLEDSEKLLSSEHLLSTTNSDNPDPTRSGSIRGVFVIGIVGGFCTFAFILWNLFSTKPEVKVEKPQENVTEVNKENLKDKQENDKLKAQLALKDQKSATAQNDSTEIVRKPVYANKTSQPQPQPQTTPSVRSQPAPPVRSQPAPRSQSLQSNPVKIDPVTTWNKLSSQSISSVVIDVPTVEVAQQPSTENAKINPVNESKEQDSTDSPMPKNNLLKQVTIGSTTLNESEPTGELGILNRAPLPSTPTPSNFNVSIPIGTMIEGEVIVPMILTQTLGGNNTKVSVTQNQQPIDTDGKFVVKLSEPLYLKGEDVKEKTLVFDSGTMFVVNATKVNSNGFVSAEVVAVLYQDKNGENVQQPLDSGVLIVTNEDGGPLVAEGSFDPGGQIASNDILLGAIGSLSALGEILNRPEQTSISTGIYGSSSTTKNSSPNLLGAALNGFFQPLTETLKDRSQNIIDDLQDRETIAVLPVGTRVNLIIKGFVKVAL